MILVPLLGSLRMSIRKVSPYVKCIRYATFLRPIEVLEILFVLRSSVRNTSNFSGSIPMP